MSRMKQTQNIDKLISSIQFVIENQCSLSEDDLNVMNETLDILRNIKKKKGKTNEQILSEVVEVVKLLTKVLL